MRKWKIEDANGNSITVNAVSKTQATKQYKRMIRGARITSITDEGEAKASRMMKIPLGGETDPPKFRPVETIRNKKAVPRPNEQCSCGSGKKYKKCCMRKKTGSAKG